MSKHNPIKTFCSVAACRMTRFFLRLLKSGGTTLPGRSALFFDSKILEVVSRGMNIIVVTGTNGKTTTCSMIRNALYEGGVKALSNVSGANLLTGITAEFASAATLTGRPKNKFAIIECDEATLKKVAPLIKPKVIVVTNLFRDQLDRYGEVMQTLTELKTGIQLVPDSTLCLNADCSLTTSLAQDVPNKIMYYGIGNVPIPGNETEDVLSDAKYCIRCGTEYEYEYHTYAHLGGFYCPNCGYKRPIPNTEVTVLASYTSTGSDVGITFRHDSSDPDKEVTRRVLIGLPALYNIYNATATLSAFMAVGWKKRAILESLAHVNSSFGRMENFNYNNVEIQMILIKNPAGCNQSLSYLASLDKDYIAVFALNDKTADGHDISWIWDADYEKVTSDPHCKKIYISGIRSADMLIRLKYAEADLEAIEVIKDKRKLIESMTSHELPVFILPNYTFMLSIRSALSSMTGGEEFWKDQRNRRSTDQGNDRKNTRRADRRSGRRSNNEANHISDNEAESFIYDDPDSIIYDESGNIIHDASDDYVYDNYASDGYVYDNSGNYEDEGENI